MKKILKISMIIVSLLGFSVTYSKAFVMDVWELTSFQANVMLKDGNPFVHSHINISDRECNSKGGHLFEATVAVVGEFILRKINLNQKRKLDPNIGLACMSLNN